MIERRFKTRAATRRLTISAASLAAALTLPFLTGQIPEIGAALLPMHLPVLLCGFICGWPWGLAVGAVAPLLRSLLFMKPDLFPTAVAMAFELAAYGGTAGFLYRILPRKNLYIYLSLVSAMFAGRVVWGTVAYALTFLGKSAFTFSAFVNGAFVNAIPGIIIQIILIPLVLISLRRAGLDRA